MQDKYRLLQTMLLVAITITIIAVTIGVILSQRAG